ncbi:SEC-C motif-containing protein [Diaminobutyricimonas aerilata]|uniref:UPF0225 protein CLV46_1699 n=1 Tax=Diaminobutyricimonas aerilata TaxID=1162967 RepID=A0A2M9CJQ4_9MICO|nr:YchJ family metal-binding protein [Diaminobutyricimonas aerilata]PJJ72135.1 SEC-C motif-containing protein [Diaminobutyricimonas aerilata]
MERCPCLSGLPYDECCGPLHRAERRAGTAEQLMRSRYSAYVRREAEYLLDTWHPSTRPVSLELDPELRWYRLDVLARERGGPLETDGVVEFRAMWRAGTERGEQYERSRFRREGGRWLYLDGS